MKKTVILFILTAVMLAFSQSAFDGMLGLGSDVSAMTVEEPEPVVLDSATINEQIKLTGFLENIFDGKNVKAEEFLGGDDPEIKGYISNLQQAPNNKNIISFEVSAPDDPSIRLFLYNIESEFLTQVSPIEDYDKSIRMMPYPVTDRGVCWHPEKDMFVFYSNGYENRDQIFIAEINDPHFMEEYPVKVSRIEFSEPKKTVNHCLYPYFNSTGEDLYFTVRIEKENKREKYNKYNNIAHAKNIFQYKENDYKEAQYEVLFNRKYDQLRPVCSPTDPDMIAFVSYNKVFKEKYGYADYSLVVHNTRNGLSVEVDKLTGFRDYPFQWSPSGKYLYYCAALPIQKTPQDFREKRVNIINLQVAEIRKFANKYKVKIEENESSSFIIGDVATKDNGIAFVSDDILLMAKYDPYESIFLVDMNKWRKNDGFYIKQLPLPDDTDFPVLGKDSFIFLKYQYFTMPDNSLKTVSTVNSIPYEPKIDEEALRKKKERRAKKKAARKEKSGGSEPAPDDIPQEMPEEFQGE